MKLYILTFLLLTIGVLEGGAKGLPKAKQIIEDMERVNSYFMMHHPVPGDSVRGKQVYPSNVWTRSVYFEGLMALHEVAPQAEYIDYTVKWANANMWGFKGGDRTRNADNLCCAQTYISLYRLTGDDSVLTHTVRALSNIVNSTRRDDWAWVDALQMAMPVFAGMGASTKDIRYFRTMMELYLYARNQVSQVGLFNEVENLWWRDSDFLPPYKEPNGKNCYWSRGNGWALAALVRSIEELERALEHYEDKEKAELQTMKRQLTEDYMSMALTLKDYQREDGFWNCSLTDEFHYGGPETTGTSLFIYGMAWGIRKHLLSPDIFTPVVLKAWHGVTRKAMHDDGFLGYVQGIGKEPKDGQPVAYDRKPDAEDFAVGCFLLAGSEMVKWMNENN